MKSIRDLVNKMPETRKELSDYVSQNERIKSILEKNPDYKTTLEKSIDASFDKYSMYLKDNIATRVSGVGHAIGYTADAWLATGDVVGSLGGKFLNLLAQIPEKAYGMAYAVRTGNYLDSAQNILEGIVSYVPGLTVVDQGLARIVQKRMISDAITKFEKEVGLYKPWTARIAEKLKSVYTDVKDRAENIFRPDYEPEMSFA